MGQVKAEFAHSFDDEMEAALAYDRKAEQLFRTFEYLNSPDLAEFGKHAWRIIFRAQVAPVRLVSRRRGSNSQGLPGRCDAKRRPESLQIFSYLAEKYDILDD
ncbi:MAG: hypothetical protein ACYTBJ_19690 [Planctomycetota bacterium]|jgi:hypothetical protein